MLDVAGGVTVFLHDDDDKAFVPQLRVALDAHVSLRGLGRAIPQNGARVLYKIVPGVRAHVRNNIL